jgi:hypothetical protein
MKDPGRYRPGLNIRAHRSKSDAIPIHPAYTRIARPTGAPRSTAPTTRSKSTGLASQPTNNSWTSSRLGRTVSGAVGRGKAMGKSGDPWSSCSRGWQTPELAT